MKNVVIIASSPRFGSNTDAMAEEFARGVRDGGGSAEIISLKGKDIGFCRGCMACQMTHNCFIRDDTEEISEKIRDADVVVFSAPVYYYSLPGQLKTLLDRCNPLYSSEYSFRDVYLLAAAADEDPSAVDGSVRAIEGWISCFEKARLCGVVFAEGVTETRDIEGHKALKEVYEMAKAACSEIPAGEIPAGQIAAAQAALLNAEGTVTS